MRVAAATALALALASVVASPGALAQSTFSSGAASTPTPAVVRLKDLGCFLGHENPRGLPLEAATIRFQSANGLSQSGRLDKRTSKRLGSARARSCASRPVPAGSGSGRRVVLSQGQNWLWLVGKDGSSAAQGPVVDNDWLPQRTYATGAQCGRPGRARHRSDPTGGLSIDFFVRFADCTVGFHQIPVARSTGRQIHPDYLAGTDLRESHGCIRVPRPLIKVLWRFTKHRTTVVVTR